MNTDALSTTLFAIADPTRRGLLAQLARGDSTVGELAAPHAMSLAAVSKHLRVLESAGLITREKDAQWRRCRLDAQPLVAVAHWLGDYQQFWERSTDKLDAYLAELQKTPTRKQKKP
ncbi:MAG: helix-turn-helix transcriptional regulator [Deltaproteobacteria bacterium]|nr:helix-turn-helix transcriptional regulator [Deltaproteobacteria bacterium]